MKRSRPDWYDKIAPEPFTQKMFTHSLKQSVQTRVKLGHNHDLAKRYQPAWWLGSGIVLLGALALFAGGNWIPWKDSGRFPDETAPYRNQNTPDKNTSITGNSPPQDSTDKLAKLPSLESLHWADQQQGWAISGQQLLRTTNGGQSWDDVTPDSLKMLSKLVFLQAGSYFSDPQQAWLALSPAEENDTARGQVSVLRTEDGGSHWESVPVDVQEPWEGAGMQKLSFIDEHNGWLLVTSDPGAGQMGKALYRTEDGGITWTRLGEISQQIESYPTGMTFLDERNGWITSINHAQDYPLIFHSGNGGRSWQPIKLSIPDDLGIEYYSSALPPVFFDSKGQEGWMPLQFYAAERLITIPYITQDGGSTWTPTTGIDSEPETVQFISSQTGFYIDRKQGLLFASTDGGDSWKERYRNPDFTEAKQLHFSDERNGWLLTEKALWTTRDGGLAWKMKAEIEPGS
ncbi:hypothetical protein [Paenibacillus sp. J2TS4]|uniref:hypothetical protein n=1 Tax=Paenibacillus sp. J2TS4 TaxID=2807194 RepID=UPI001B2C9581|nr:hypothetical protein [Paenibacillus sp. J2TS4]GIP35905.1 hypothetical protein J2TS4_51150 [Paenibacillus sp. J2TS4]